MLISLFFFFSINYIAAVFLCLWDSEINYIASLLKKYLNVLVNRTNYELVARPCPCLALAALYQKTHKSHRPQLWHLASIHGDERGCKGPEGPLGWNPRHGYLWLGERSTVLNCSCYLPLIDGTTATSYGIMYILWMDHRHGPPYFWFPGSSRKDEQMITHAIFLAASSAKRTSSIQVTMLYARLSSTLE